MGANNLAGTVTSGTLPIVGATLNLWSSALTAVQVGTGVVTDSTGHFTINFTCPAAGTLMYVTASGGHIGSGAANTHIELASALGACGSMPASIVVNELTTAATSYALAGFASATTGAATVAFYGKSPGLDQAFNTLTNLTVTSTGAFETTGPETNQSFIQQTLDTVADALAACDASSTATPCTELFSCATPNATYVATGQACTVSGSPTLPTDTLTAAIAVTQHPGTVSTQGILDVGTTHGNPYTPVLGASPNDWTLPMVYTITNYGPLAIDANGHVWVLTVDPNPPTGTTDPQTVVAEFDANFNLLSPAQHYFNGGGLASFDHTDLSNLAFDTLGNVWIGGGANTDRIVELNSAGAGISSASGFAAGSGPDGTAGVAIDSAGNPWFASGITAASVFELNSTGTNVSGTSGFAASNCPCNGITADPTGDVWTIGSAAGQFLAEMTANGTQQAIQHPAGYSSATFYAIAGDAQGNLWIGDQHDHGVWEYSPGTGFLPASGGPFINNAASGTKPKGIAIDGAGHKWIANQSTSVSSDSSLTELSADGTVNLSPLDGFGSGAINGAYSVAVDASGNVWVADGGTTVIQFIGAAAPTKTPIVKAITTGFAP